MASPHPLAFDTQVLATIAAQVNEGNCHRHLWKILNSKHVHILITDLKTIVPTREALIPNKGILHITHRAGQRGQYN